MAFDGGGGGGFETFTVTCAEAKPPPAEVREVFRGGPRRLFRLDRLASVAGGPLALLTAWLDLARFPGLPAQDFTKVPLYATLERLYGVQMGRALSTIEVVQIKDDEALPTGGELREDLTTLGRNASEEKMRQQVSGGGM